MKKLFTFLCLALFVNTQMIGKEEFGFGLEFDKNLYEEVPQSVPLVTRSFTKLPKSFSLKAYAPTPKSQGRQGSCVGWATAYGARTISYAIKMGWRNQQSTIDQNVFSPAYVYKGGIIFHLNAANKLIKVAVPKDLEEDLRWPNAMDYSENLIVQSFDDWYLPSIDELQEMRIILYTRLEMGQFNDDYYWSSETVVGNPTNAYGVFFPNGNVGPIEKDRQNDVSLNFVRPVRQIQL